MAKSSSHSAYDAQIKNIAGTVDAKKKSTQIIKVNYDDSYFEFTQYNKNLSHNRAIYIALRGH